jgi:hypothetical protein
MKNCNETIGNRTRDNPNCEVLLNKGLGNPLKIKPFCLCSSYVSQTLCDSTGLDPLKCASNTRGSVIVLHVAGGGAG